MKVKILGCGTSTGIPIPLCTCAVCTSENPKNRRFKSSILIGSDDYTRTILVDAGSDFRHQALTFKIPRVDSMLLTHGHADHVFGIDDIRAYNFMQDNPIQCHASAETLVEIRRIFNYIWENGSGYEGGLLPSLIFNELQYGEVFETAGFTVTPFPLGHGRTTVTGYRIGSFAYATDCKVIPPQSRAILEGVKTLIIDGLRYEPHNTHLTIPEAVQFAQEIGATRTILTHMTHSVEYETELAKLPSGVEPAYDGLELTVED